MRFPDDVPVLTDETVTLRAPTMDDVDAIVEQCNDPESIAWTTVPVPYHRGDAVDWVSTTIPKGWADGTDLCFAIEYAGGFAGSAGLRPDGQGTAEVAFGLHPAARGGGVASRAVRLLLDWGFGERDLAVVTWRCNAGNWASRRVAWATVFGFGETVPRMLAQRGDRHDAWTGWITADDSREPKDRWLDVPVLTDGGVTLRPLRADDLDRVAQSRQDPRFRHFLPRTPAEFDAAVFAERMALAAAQGRRVTWAIADATSDRLLGDISLGMDPTGGDVAYGVHPDARGRGVLTAALRLVARHGLASTERGGLGLHRLFVLTAASNTASCHAAESAGFVRVGTERRSLPTGDGYDDAAVYDRLAHD